MYPFETDVRGLAVPGIYLHVVAQRHEFVLDAGNERGVVATGKIGAPDAAVKQHVAGDEKAVFAAEERNAAGRVTGRMDDLQPGVAKFDHFALLHEAARLRRKLRFGQAVHAAHLGYSLKDGQIVAVDFERQAVSIGYKGIAENVIEVAMGIEQSHGAQLSAGYFAGQFIAFADIVAAGVNDDALAGVIVDQISVF